MPKNMDNYTILLSSECVHCGLNVLAQGDVKVPRSSTHLWAIILSDRLEAPSACSFLKLSAPLVSVYYALLLVPPRLWIPTPVLPVGSASTHSLHAAVPQGSFLWVTGVLILQNSLWIHFSTPWLIIYWWHLGLCLYSPELRPIVPVRHSFTENLLCTRHCPRCYRYRIGQNTNGSM